VNWLSPTKIRTTIFGGSRQIVVWDDLNPSQRLSFYDKGVDMRTALSGGDRHEALVSYRSGDMVAPALPVFEALDRVVTEFAEAIRSARPPLTDGNAGMRVVRILEAVDRSLDSRGAAVPLVADLTSSVPTSTEAAAR
jgi:predicted dehydrogenase